MHTYKFNLISTLFCYYDIKYEENNRELQYCIFEVSSNLIKKPRLKRN